MKKVFKKLRKVSTMKTTAVNPTSHLSLPCVVTDPQPQYRSILGQLLQILNEARLNPPKSNLARIVVAPADTKQNLIVGLADETKIKNYASYVVFCAAVGVEPRNIEDWDSQRGQQRITTTQKDSLLHTKQPRSRFFPSMVREKVGTSRKDSQGDVIKRTIVRVVSVS